MRYTTLIDISEYRQLYANQNVRLVYLHLVLRSGYHDHDRDLVKISIRSLSADVGISVSATRNALNMLLKWQMIKRVNDMWAVRKWCYEQPISTRAKTQREAKKEAQQRAAVEERERQSQMAELDRKQRKAEQADRDKYQDFVKEMVRKSKMGDPAAMAWVKEHPMSSGLASI